MRTGRSAGIGKRQEEDTEAESHPCCFWEIILTALLVLILILLLVCYYRSVYSRMLQICERYKKCCDEEAGVRVDSAKGDVCKADSCAKQRFSWPTVRSLTRTKSSFQKKSNSQQSDKCCKLKSVLQERKKLLARSSTQKDEIVPSNNTELAKRLSLNMCSTSFTKMNLRSMSETNKSKQYLRKTSSNLNDRGLTNNTRSEKNIERAKNYEEPWNKERKDVCFSDTDLKFLVIPISSKRFDNIKKEKKTFKRSRENSKDFLNDENIYHSSTRSKFDDADAIVNYTNCSIYSCVSRNFDVDPKCPSDIEINELDETVDNDFLDKSKKRFFFDRAESNETEVSVRSKCNLNSKFDGTEITEETDSQSLKVLSSRPSKLIEDHAEKEGTNCGISNIPSDISVDSINPAEIKQDVEVQNYFQVDGTSIPSVLELQENRDADDLSVPDTQTCETYDELGLLFSHYMKLQSRYCERTYCLLSRLLKRIGRHNERKCRKRFNRSRVYSFDQRPACNSGNVCRDTYDELSLMHASPRKRKNVYRRMFERRKRFLNQPYVSSFGSPSF